jgi:hypothetical protein
MVSKTKKTKSRSSQETSTPDSLQKQIKVILASFFSVEKLLNKHFSELESKWLSFDSYFNLLKFTLDSNKGKIERIKVTLDASEKKLKSTPIVIMNVSKKNTNKVKKSNKKGNKKSFETGYKSRVESTENRISGCKTNLEKLTSENDSIEEKLPEMKRHIESLKVSYAEILGIAEENHFSNLESPEHKKIPQDTDPDVLITKMDHLKANMYSFKKLCKLLNPNPCQDEKTELDEYAKSILDEHRDETSTHMVNVVKKHKIDFNSMMLIEPLNNALEDAKSSVPFLAEHFLLSVFFRSFDTSFNPFASNQCELGIKLFITLATLKKQSGTQYDHVAKLNTCYQDNLVRLDEMISIQFDQTLISKFQSWSSPAHLPLLVNTIFFAFHSDQFHAQMAFAYYLASHVIIRSIYKDVKSSFSDVSFLSPRHLSRVLKQTRDNLSIAYIELSIHFSFIVFFLLLKYLVGAILVDSSSEADQLFEKMISSWETHLLRDYRFYSFIALIFLVHNVNTETSNTMPSLEDLNEQKKRSRQCFDKITGQLYVNAVLESRHSLLSKPFKSPLSDINSLTSYLVSWGKSVYFTLNVMRGLSHLFSSQGFIAPECDLLSNKSNHDQFLFHSANSLTFLEMCFPAGFTSLGRKITQFCSIHAWTSDGGALRFFNEIDPKCTEANLIRSLPFYCVAFSSTVSIMELCKAHLDHRESCASSSSYRSAEDSQRFNLR